MMAEQSVYRRRVLVALDPCEVDPSDFEASARLAAGLAGVARESGTAVRINRVGSMMTGFFTDGEVTNFESAAASDTERHAGFFQAMLRNGVYLAPSQFEALFVSLAHGEAEIDRTIEAAGIALAESA